MQRPPAVSPVDDETEPTIRPVQAATDTEESERVSVPATEMDPEVTERVQDEVESLVAVKAEAEANENKFLRARADLENYRRRMGRERRQIAQEAKKDVLLKVLDVMDNLVRALSYEQSGSQLDAKALLMGLRMTMTQFEDVLSSVGVQEVAALGEQFNPRCHEAVGTVLDAGRTEGLIVEEVRAGYRLSDALLRPAQVKVVAHPSEMT